MPTYEYKCLECHEIFEEFQKITDPPVTRCKKCGGEVKRLISGGSGLLFKGTGFYITDYRSESYKKEASKDKPSKETARKSDDKKPSEKKEKSEAKAAK